MRETTRTKDLCRRIFGRGKELLGGSSTSRGIGTNPFRLIYACMGECIGEAVRQGVNSRLEKPMPSVLQLKGSKRVITPTLTLSPFFSELTETKASYMRFRSSCHLSQVIFLCHQRAKRSSIVHGPVPVFFCIFLP